MSKQDNCFIKFLAKVMLTYTYIDHVCTMMKAKIDCLTDTYKLCGAFKTLVVTSGNRRLDISAYWTAGHTTHIPNTDDFLYQT